MPILFEDSGDVELGLSDLPIIYWHNVVTEGIVSADTEDPSFPITNIANSNLALKWKQDTTDSPLALPDFITINCTGLGPINYIALAGHNFATANVTVQLLGSSGDGLGSPLHQDSPPEGEYVTGYRPTDNGPIIFMFTEVEDAIFRLMLNSPGTIAAELAVVYAGQYTVMEEGIQADHTPLPLAKVHDNVLGQSENGSFLGRIMIGAWAQSQASFANMTKEWIRDELLDFLDFAAEEPFFWAWSPLTYPNEVAFAYLANDPQPIFDIDGYGAITFDMKGIVE